MPGATSNYNALEINYGHRFSQGLNLNASFTWSKYMDGAWGPGWGYMASRDNLHGQYSLSGNDIPRSLVLSYIYELPVGRGKKFGAGMNAISNGIVGGWQVAGNMDAYNGDQFPNCVGNPRVAAHTTQPDGGILWVNSAAYAQPAPYTFGNCSRTQGNIRAMGRNNWDLNLSKDWRWGEKMRVQFRGEFFNAFNHTYLFAPDQALPDATFGEVSSSGPPRDIQLGLKVYW
jgi:hypothetical protein